jgi:hypothetical protein
VVAWSSTAVTTGFVRGHRAPVTTNNRRLHRDSHHRCTRMCKRPNLPPVFQVQSSLLRAPTTNLTGPVATPAPCGVICHLRPFLPGGLPLQQGPRGARSIRGAPLPHSHNALVATPCSVCPPAGGPSGGPGVPPQHRGPASVWRG